MDFKFVLPTFHINFDIYKLILNSIKLKLSILSPKITIMAISQNHILPKCHSPKSQLLLHFSMNLSETLRINVNMDFTNTTSGRFNFEPKILKKGGKRGFEIWPFW